MNLTIQIHYQGQAYTIHKIVADQLEIADGYKVETEYVLCQVLNRNIVYLTQEALDLYGTQLN